MQLIIRTRMSSVNACFYVLLKTTTMNYQFNSQAYYILIMIETVHKYKLINEYISVGIIVFYVWFPYALNDTYM